MHFPEIFFSFSLIVVAVLPIISWQYPGLLESQVELGIDLGTTYSVVATCTEGQVTVHEVDSALTVPSVAFFNESSQYQLSTVVVGEVARKLRDLYPEATIYDAKRLIGREFDDPYVREEAGALSYNIAEDVDGRAVALMKYRHVRPEEVATMILKKLKSVAEGHAHWAHRMLGFRFKQVTVSVPVGFPQDAREATITAAGAAGFSQVRLLEEPVAAAIAYDLDHQATADDHIVLVYDFGGGTLDVALLSLDPKQGTFLVLGTEGDNHLGGEDFDRAIARKYLNFLQERVDLDEAQRHDVMPWLTHAAEHAKCALSEADSAALDLDVISRTAAEGSDAKIDELELPASLKAVWGRLQAALTDPSAVLTREGLVGIVRALLDRSMRPIDLVLEGLELAADDVDDVVLVGGSSRLVAVRELMVERFGADRMRFDVDPDTAIAAGAAKSWACRQGKR